jgi:hypothetical protein
VAGCRRRLGYHCSDLLLTGCVSATAADEEFDQLCFEYGIELDDVVSFLLACLLLGLQQPPQQLYSLRTSHGAAGC